MKYYTTIKHNVYENGSNVKKMPMVSKEGGVQLL